MITIPDVIIFLRLLAAHLLADFFLQTTKWITAKKNGPSSIYLYYHIAVVGILTYLFLGDWTQWQLPLFIMITHFLIDTWKSTKRDTAKYFVIDQLLHILMLIVGWAWYIGINMTAIQIVWNGMNSSSFWIVISSFLLILRPAGFLIEKLTSKWRRELKQLPINFDGLDEAGTWIGYLERFIILIFILVGQYSAIGFLIAAKSIFRFMGNDKNEQRRKHTEYILIGTLLSFTGAIVVGIAARALLY